MARVTGSDVILKLMTTVAELQHSMREQSEKMEQQSEATKALSDSMSQVSSRMRSSEGLFGRLAKLLGEYANQTKGRFDDLEERVGRLEASSGK